jgi:hypothetical protein
VLRFSTILAQASACVEPRDSRRVFVSSLRNSPPVCRPVQTLDDQCARTRHKLQTKGPETGPAAVCFQPTKAAGNGHWAIPSYPPRFGALLQRPIEGRLSQLQGLVCTIMSSAFTEGGDVPAGASSGPSRPHPIRYISPAALNLHRVYEQNRQRLQKKDGAKVPDPTMTQTKGKPRLLLMGQRR